MRGRRLLQVILLAAALLPYFVNLGATSIIDANEAFYAQTPVEMMASGDCISPTFNGEPRLNKPPLSYWAVAASYKVFGVSLFAARLPIALGAVVIVMTAFFLGRLAFSPGAGFVAAVTLAASPRVLLFSRRIIIDIYTTMFVGLALACFARAEIEPQPARRRAWLLAMYAAIGLGVMTKGPVAIALPALVFAGYLALTGRLRTVTRLMLPTGAVVVAAIVAPYYAALCAQEGWGAISSFLLRENLARYTSGVGAPDRGPLFYLPVVLGDFYFPWSLLLPAAFALVPWRSVLAGRGWARIWGGPGAEGPVAPERVRLLLGLWIILIVAFFSLSNGQQDLYVLPFVTAAAPLVGGLVAAWAGSRLTGRLDRVATWSVAAIAVALAAAGAGVAWFVGRPGGRIHLAGALATGGVLIIGGAAALAALKRHARAVAAIGLAAAAILSLWIIVIRSLPDYERYQPVPQLARVIRAGTGPAPAVATYLVAAPSLVFYLNRHVHQLFDREQLHAFLRANPSGLCLMTDDEYAAVRESLPVPTHVVASAPRMGSKLVDFLNRAPLRMLVLIGPA
ncbi:MAG TPA: glycosyltransferase family 39 protein [Vicinamibacterales bacterium]|nr:glycosyltransferase family 39 protein [Vicinamibacterales bacterium]HPW21187.1 glycosyltransferase family 39 protein [Vicinamibacterales bacterium]